MGKYRTIARKRWPRAMWINGSGPYASLSSCPPGDTIELFESRADAEIAKSMIDDCGCGGDCMRRHSIADLRTPPKRVLEKTQQIQ